MDAVPITIAASIGAVLVAAILGLWHVVTVGNNKCEERNGRLEGEVRGIHEMLLARASEDAKRAESRERWAWDRSAELSVALNGIGEVTSRTLRVLRRYEQDHKPTDDALRIKHPSGETTTFIKANK